MMISAGMIQEERRTVLETNCKVIYDHFLNSSSSSIFTKVIIIFTFPLFLSFPSKFSDILLMMISRGIHLLVHENCSINIIIMMNNHLVIKKFRNDIKTEHENATFLFLNCFIINFQHHFPYVMLHSPQNSLLDSCPKN